ncbi:MAG: GNAT family N-acetyltransferase [Anaerolineales bacterium]|nr:GNAT family N-acetyltransferase [Anaerolineales bacterium]
MARSDPSIKIATATWQDFGPIRRLEQVCFPQDAWPFWDILGALTLPQIVRLKAVAGEEIVGFIAVDIRESKGEAWIMTVGVLPGFRRMGIASSLIMQAESEAGTRAIRLHVRISNKSAQALYEALGYAEYDRWARYYPGGEDAVLMEKIIDLR